MASDASLDVVVRFIGDASKLTSETDKIDGIGSKIGGFAKGAATALGGVFAVSMVKDWVTGAAEAQKVSATLAQTLANAGDASGQWAKHAEDLASNLQSQTGVDDEVIKGGQAILATFHAVSDATGQAAGTFDRATKAAVDMSAAGFGSVESASTMLGKALQDPVKGITALGKAGVTFTQQQKDQIKALTESGDALGAQNIILQEVEKQVGGTAAASATSTDKMTAAFGDTTDAVGAALIPALNALLPVITAVAGFVQQNSAWLVPLAGAILAVVAAVKAWAVIQAVINVLMAANPIVLIILGIVALVAAIVILIKNWDTVAAVAEKAWGVILGVIQGVWDWIKANWPTLLAILTGPIGAAVLIITRNWDTIRNGIETALNWVRTNWPTILAVLTGPVGIAVALIVAHWDTIRNALSGAIAMMRGLWEGFVTFVSGIPGRIVSFFAGIASSLYNVGKDWMANLARGVGDAAGAVLDKAKSIAGDALDLLNPFGSPQTKAFYQGQAVMADYMRGIESRQRSVTSVLAGVGGRVAPGLAARSGGRQTINVNVTMQPGSDPVTTGKTIVQLIRQYERANGTAWRETASA